MVKCRGHRTNKEGDFEIWEENERQSQAWTRVLMAGKEAGPGVGVQMQGQEVAMLNGVSFMCRCCFFYFSCSTFQAAVLALYTYCPQWKNSAFSFKIELLKSLAKADLKAECFDL